MILVTGLRGRACLNIHNYQWFDQKYKYHYFSTWNITHKHILVVVFPDFFAELPPCIPFLPVLSMADFFPVHFQVFLDNKSAFLLPFSPVCSLNKEKWAGQKASSEADDKRTIEENLLHNSSIHHSKHRRRHIPLVSSPEE